MRKTTTAALMALTALASCTAEAPATDSGATRAEHRTTPNDTTATASGISFDLSDTAMEEDAEWICFESEDWQPEEVNADL